MQVVLIALLLHLPTTAPRAAEFFLSAQPAYPHGVSYDNGNWSLAWEINGERVDFRLMGKTDGWVAVGFSPTDRMKDADMVFGWVRDDGSYNVIDAYATGTYGPHPADTDLGGTYDLTDTYAESSGNGFTDVVFSRKLVTGDPYDHDLPLMEDIDIIWAYGDTDDWTQHHANRGHGQILLDPSKAVVSVDDNWVDPLVSVYKLYHAFAMGLGVLAVLIGFTIARRRKKIRKWINKHRVSVLTAAGIFLLGVYSVIRMKQLGGYPHLSSTHSWVGAFVTLLILFNVILATNTRMKKGDVKKFWLVHRRIGWTILILAIINAVVGLLKSGLI